MAIDLNQYGYSLFLVPSSISLPLHRDRKELFGLKPPAYLDNVFCTGKRRQEVTFPPFPRLLIQSQNIKSVHQALRITLFI